MNKFSASIEIIGINPYVFVPDSVLKDLFREAGKNKGSIPIRGMINNSMRSVLELR
ncbi:hypothetical protein [Pedobacter sp. HMWF019]|uniref:hypothetical protein n=1 Tax=Pedobacter sp. HMWF019 TaxID=2056856 RepID=UPI001304A20A|nr:hypothetical protein [Pedobacter sp. HMWF019]